jgi:hypothetical protein
MRFINTKPKEGPDFGVRRRPDLRGRSPVTMPDPVEPSAQWINFVDTLLAEREALQFIAEGKCNDFDAPTAVQVARAALAQERTDARRLGDRPDFSEWVEEIKQELEP